MLALEGRAAWPSLFIFAAALLLLAAAPLAAAVYRWGAIALLVIACAPWRALPRVSLTLALTLFCGWLVADALFITPAYSSEGLYRPLILLAAFAAFASFEPGAVKQSFRIGLAILAGLVLLGLMQYLIGSIRAAAVFRTPNTFATVVNLFLVPLVVLYLTAERSPKVLMLILWLFAGLVASQSRGGMLALFAGLAFIALCLGRDRLRAAAKAAGRLILGAALVWAVVSALGEAAVMLQGGESWFAERNLWSRSDIYATTLRLIFERPWLGGGANMFWPLFEPHCPERFGEDASFLFAHNDYLQTWLEYGLPGLLLLLAVVVLALRAAHAAARRGSGDWVPVACGGALASCFAHAVVDFPFYIPFILFIVGGYLGVLASHEQNLRPAPAIARAESPGVIGVPMRAALALAVLALLAQPMLAQMATDRAIKVLSRGEVDGGLYWQSVARRLEPRNVMHYWGESVIWRNLAEDTGDRRYWAKADKLLKEGAEANPPFAFNITLDRARMHRLHADKLDNAASPAEIVAWVQSALIKAPRSVIGQREFAEALAFAGRKEEAERIQKALRARTPDTAFVRTLIGEAR